MLSLSSRLIKLKKRLYKVEFSTLNEWWFENVNILDLPEYTHLSNSSIVLRKAYSLQYIAKNLPIIIKDDELVVGVPNQNSVEFGMSIPKYLTDEERKYFAHYGLSEQSLPAHHPPAWEKIIQKGVLGIKKSITEQMKKARDKSTIANSCFEEWESMLISLDALTIYAERYAERLEELIKREKSEDRKDDYKKILKVCRSVPLNPAQTLHEAVQSYWFLYTILNSGGEFLPLGRLDQYFYPYYKTDMDNGVIDEDEANEILGSFLIKCNERVVFETKKMTAHRDVGFIANSWRSLNDVGLNKEKEIQSSFFWHGKENVDYNKFFGQETNNKMMTAVVGGKDRNGDDATNVLSRKLLDLMTSLELLFPTFGVRFHKDTPKDFVTHVAAILQHGQGEPIIYNDEAILRGYKNLNISQEDARDYSSDGCWETVIPGKTNFVYNTLYVLNCLEYTMNNGYSVKNKRQESFATGELKTFVNYNDFYNAFLKHMRLQMKGIYNNFLRNIGITGLVAPDPLFSAMSNKCVEFGEDYYCDGAEYQSRMILMAGFANTVNSLAVIKKLVFEYKYLTLTELNRALLANWNGYERLRALVINRVPKYGNDNDYTDDIGDKLLHDFTDELRELRKKSDKIELLGGVGTFHVYAALGNMTGASADGRYAYDALAPNYSPVPGTDIKGPLSAILSSVKPDLTDLMSGTPLDISININDFCGEAGVERLSTIIKTFCNLGGQILTITANSVEELKDAKIHPDKHKNLLVRMGGLSAYFITLTSLQQDKIIERFNK